MRLFTYRKITLWHWNSLLDSPRWRPSLNFDFREQLETNRMWFRYWKFSKVPSLGLFIFWESSSFLRSSVQNVFCTFNAIDVRNLAKLRQLKTSQRHVKHFKNLEYRTTSEVCFLPPRVNIRNDSKRLKYLRHCYTGMPFSRANL